MRPRLGSQRRPRIRGPLRACAHRRAAWGSSRACPRCSSPRIGLLGWSCWSHHVVVGGVTSKVDLAATPDLGDAFACPLLPEIRENAAMAEPASAHVLKAQEHDPLAVVPLLN